jgi:hypothetical protein
MFKTDRGPAQMSAWVFTFAGGQTWSYPAIAPTAWWVTGAFVRYSAVSAVLSVDGRSLKIGFVGFAPVAGRCDANYVGVAAESDAAVAIVIQTAQSPAYGCQLAIATRFVNVPLQVPLGGRVVVEENGLVIVVCPANPVPGSPVC